MINTKLSVFGCLCILLLGCSTETIQELTDAAVDIKVDIMNDASEDSMMDTTVDTMLDMTVDSPCGTCPMDKPLCDTDNVCQVCLQSSDCMDVTAPRCDSNAMNDANACAACVDDSDCEQFTDTRICNPNGSCVACQMDAHCEGNPNGSVCNTTTNECMECKEDSHCAGNSNGTACNEATNECVGCMKRLGNEPRELAYCNGKICDGATLTCTDVVGATVEQCMPCAADVECVTGSRCIETTYNGSFNGGYCMKVANTGCEKPYKTVITRPSIDGVGALGYCGINESLTTCNALILHNGSCDDACINAGGVCRTYLWVHPITNQTEFRSACSYLCSSAEQCEGECDKGALSQMSTPKTCSVEQ